ncbi:sigma 54-interacting transcriptional regulator [Clostridium sp. cel8]|jgi:sigma-54 dependent transcriptional regulator, acetoin dehydrogenase operon transcriptional activator AcoR|nr:sigma 54-interacting transcriptional regulator [Clostridium sp. cel8]
MPMETIKYEHSLETIIESPVFKSILESIYDGIIITDNNLYIKASNPSASNILGVEENKLKKISMNEILKKDYIKSPIKTGEKMLDEDLKFHINNRYIRCVVNIVPIKVDKNVIGLIFLLRDTKKLHHIVNNVVGYKASFTFDDIITKSKNMISIVNQAKKIAKTDCSILIEGKSGTGKEVFAQSIHNYSKRHNAPFVAVNCAAIPRELVESELFGYEKGAFTGASKGGYPGKFELADGGTIFLDEIGELPLDVQSKLLRFLDNLKIVRVGATYEKAVDVRIIAATNKLLAEEVKNKNFRSDLYYRLNVMKLHLPPLNERSDDIELLAHYFINKLNAKNPSCPKYIDSTYISKLKSHNFQGNIRELRNLVESSYYLCESNIITSNHLNCNNTNTTYKTDLDKDDTILPLVNVEKICIENALNKFKGNVSKSAKALGIGKATMYRKIKKFNINLQFYNKKI